MVRLMVFIFMISISAHAASNDLYPFEQNASAERFAQLSHQFRCLVCQNQSIADSDAPIAKDLRDAIYRQIKLGRTDQEIKQFMVARYGEFVLFEPPVNTHTLWLWLAPALLLLLGALVMASILRKRIE